jgi:hypothetical protein
MRLNIYKLILYFLNLLKNILKIFYPGHARLLGFQVDQESYTSLTESITSTGGFL